MAMLRSAASKVMWVGRATVFAVGLAVILALVFGAASVAFGATGGNFVLGQTNVASALTKLTGNVNGAAMQVANTNPGLNDQALNLTVNPGEAPMRVNSDGRVTNLNADELDGRGADRIGVNGLQRVIATSDSDSQSQKGARAECPVGKVLVGTGYDLFGGKEGPSPNEETNVVVDEVTPLSKAVNVAAFEEEPTASGWSVSAFAICATAP